MNLLLDREWKETARIKRRTRMTLGRHSSHTRLVFDTLFSKEKGKDKKFVFHWIHQMHIVLSAKQKTLQQEEERHFWRKERQNSSKKNWSPQEISEKNICQRRGSTHEATVFRVRIPFLSYDRDGERDQISEKSWYPNKNKINWLRSLVSWMESNVFSVSWRNKSINIREGSASTSSTTK